MSVPRIEGVCPTHRRTDCSPRRNGCARLTGVRRTNRTARQAGAKFERDVADHLARHVDDRIDRRVKTGAKDRGDIAALRGPHGQRIVVECKDVTRTDIGVWVREAEVERGNDDALAGVVVHKRRGNARPGDQYVTMTLDDLIAILTGVRPGVAA